MNLEIRRAYQTDEEIIIEFNKAMAFETEEMLLQHNIISEGVRNMIENPSLGFYIVAESDNQIIGSLMITTEWSDWRNGIFWWIQSVYVLPEHRRHGVYRNMYKFIKYLAESNPEICGFRLYVEKQNIIAQDTYKALGMEETHYRLFEELK